MAIDNSLMNVSLANLNYVAETARFAIIGI